MIGAVTSPRKPRRWQGEVLPLLRAHLRDPAQGPCVVVAATGSGKSWVQAELTRLAVDAAPHGGVVVYATSRTSLVKQIGKDLRAVLPGRVGRYDGHQKRVTGYPAVATTYKSMGACISTIQATRGHVWALILDEAHNSAAETVEPLVQALVAGGLRRVYGFSATAFRSRVKETLAIFDTCLYRYEFAQALEDGILVPYRYITREGDAVEGVDGLIAMVRDTNALSYGAGLVTCRTIEESETLAAQLTEAGIRARAVSSATGRKILVEVERAFLAGTLDCIVSPRLVSEGYDFQPLKWVALHAPCKSRVLMVQTIGRGLRSVDPKRYPEAVARWGEMRECLVLDPHDQLGKVGIRHEPALGAREEEPENKPRKAREERESPLPRSGYLPPTEGPAAWASMLLEWAWQQPHLRPFVGDPLKRRTGHVTRPMRKAAEEMGQILLAPKDPQQYLTARALSDACRQKRAWLERHRQWRYLLDGLQLVDLWGYDPKGAGASRRMDAEVILRAAKVLQDYLTAERAAGRPGRLELPDWLVPVKTEDVA